MQNHQKLKSHQKSIFSCNVYRTNHESRATFPSTIRSNHFKSISCSGNCFWNEPQVLYLNEKALKKQPNKRDTVKECSTQTSKTIIQLARIESERADEDPQMSPDSLANSPRNREVSRFQSSMENNCNCSVSQRLSEYSIDGSCHFDYDYMNDSRVTDDVLSFLPTGDYRDKPLTMSFLERSKNRKPEYPASISEAISPTVNNNNHTTKTIRCQNLLPIKSKSFIDNYRTCNHPNYIKDHHQHRQELPIQPPRPKPATPYLQSKPGRPRTIIEPQDTSFVRRRSSSICYRQTSNFMCPTASSQIKSKLAEIKSVNSLIPPTRRGRSTSPKPSGDHRRFESSRKIPYIDQSKSDVSSATTIVNLTRNPEAFQKTTRDEEVEVISDCVSERTVVPPYHNSNVDFTISAAVNRFRDPDWRISLRGLAEIVELCRIIDIDQIYEYMISINQRLIELLRSPRSHVCRTACQAAGHLFEYVKDTRKPEFDDIVDLLLFKTADSNKFIRQDANLALDCMVTHISTYNAVRALCARGPYHKNHLVRCATIRLLVCAVVIAGPDFILNPNNNEYTRKRIILHLAKFLEDKNLETRKFAERLYKVLCKESRFDVYLKKYLDRDQVMKIKANLKLIHKK